MNIRPIQPGDREALHAGFERLSPESRYRRFFTAKPTLGSRELTYLTEVDHHDHEALIAFDEETGRLAAVARYVRTAPHEAEPAVTVADDFQGQGIGSRMMAALAERAREEGIDTFRANVLPHNQPAINVLERLGDSARRQMGSELEVVIDLTPGPVAESSLRSLLRAAASGALQPAVTLLDELGLRPRFGPPDRDALENRIAVDLDPSDPDGPAVRVAGELARALGAQIELVAARRPIIDDEDRVRADAERVAEDLRGSGLQATAHVHAADPVAALVDVARERRVRLAVISAGRAEGMPRLLPGDLPRAVARQAPCDVLIAR